MRSVITGLIGILLSACSWHPCTPEYHEHYQHIGNLPPFDYIEKTDRYLVLLVCARHLDYSNGKQLLKTIARHPSDGGKNSDVGHAWILLCGDDGRLEGGHTGEFGIVQPRYFEGVADLIDSGDSNPIRYLWETQKDGVFQNGSGGFVPTFAARVHLTKEQYLSIKEFVFSDSYPFSDYAITQHQCATFVASVAKLAGLELDHQITIPIEKKLFLGGDSIDLWSDPRFSELKISTPDVLEKSLIQAVHERKALNATKWYIKRYPKKKSISEQFQSINLLKQRYVRFKKII